MNGGLGSGKTLDVVEINTKSVMGLILVVINVLLGLRRISLLMEEQSVECFEFCRSLIGMVKVTAGYSININPVPLASLASFRDCPKG